MNKYIVLVPTENIISTATQNNETIRFIKAMFINSSDPSERIKQIIYEKNHPILFNTVMRKIYNREYKTALFANAKEFNYEPTTILMLELTVDGTIVNICTN